MQTWPDDDENAYSCDAPRRRRRPTDSTDRYTIWKQKEREYSK